MENRVLYLNKNGASSISFTFENQDGSSADLSGFTFSSFKVKVSLTGKTLLEVVVGGPDSVTLSGDTLTIALTDDKTNAITNPGKYVGQVTFLNSASDKVQTDPFEVQVARTL